MKREFNRVFEEFAAEVAKMPATEAEQLLQTFRLLTQSLRDLPSNERKKALSQISKYLEGRANVWRLSKRELRTDTLRQLRNRRVHGSKPSSKELKGASDMFWRALLRGAYSLDRKDLRNLLEYSLSASTPTRGDMDQEQIVSHFWDIFRHLSEAQREIVFRDLLIRLFSDREFARVLEEEQFQQK